METELLDHVNTIIMSYEFQPHEKRAKVAFVVYSYTTTSLSIKKGDERCYKSIKEKGARALDEL